MRLLLALLCCCLVSGELSFKRQTLTKSQSKDITLYVHARSPDAALLLVLVRFADERRSLHDALSLNPASSIKYQAVSMGSDEFGRRLPVTTRGDHLLLIPFSVAKQLAGSPYDAALSLDYYSSIWSQYSAWVLEQQSLRLLTHHEAWRAQQRHPDEYANAHRFVCQRQTNATWLLTHCLLTLPAASLRFNDVPFDGRVRVDLQSPLNYLPADLFLRWMRGERDLRLTWQPPGSSQELLWLNAQFEYVLGEGDDVVLGIDVAHLFRRVEYHVAPGNLTLWYSALYRTAPLQEFAAFVMALFVGGMLWMLYHWIGSPNYDVLLTLLRHRAAAPRHSQHRRHLLGAGVLEVAEPTHDSEPASEEKIAFAYYVVLLEIFAVLTAFILWITTSVLGGLWFNTQGLTHQQERQILLLAFSVLHAIFMLTFLLLKRELTAHALRYYWKRFQLLTTDPERQIWDAREYAELKRLATTTGETVAVRDVVMRNLLVEALLVSNLLLVLNYLAEQKPLYLFLFLIVSLWLFFFETKLLFVGFLHLSTDCRRSQHRGCLPRSPLYVFFLLICLVVFALYVGFAIPTGILPFFRAVNSMYSESAIRAVAVTFVALSIVAGLFVAFMPLYWTIRQRR